MAVFTWAPKEKYIMKDTRAPTKGTASINAEPVFIPTQRKSAFNFFQQQIKPSDCESPSKLKDYDFYIGKLSTVCFRILVATRGFKMTF